MLRKVELAIDYPYNPGEWRLSKKVTGPRGGTKWEKIYSTSATGGNLQIRLVVGATYKTTYWSNGWPSSDEFTVQPGPDEW